MYYSSWDKLYIYQLVEEDICMYAVGWMKFGPRTTMTGTLKRPFSIGTVGKNLFSSICHK